MALNLAEQFLGLPADRKKQVHRYLCGLALEAWHRFAAEAAPITYWDSVVGMPHSVDFQLPTDAFHAAFNSSDKSIVAAIEYRYGEPIAALQDWDVEFPQEVQYGYYAIYNAFLKYAVARDIDDWLIVNQALSVSTQEQAWNPRLQDAMQQTT